MHKFPLNTPVTVRHKRDGRLIAGAVTAHILNDKGQPVLRAGEPVYRVQMGPATEVECVESQLTEVSYGD